MVIRQVSCFPKPFLAAMMMVPRCTQSIIMMMMPRHDGYIDASGSHTHDVLPVPTLSLASHVVGKHGPCPAAQFQS